VDRAVNDWFDRANADTIEAYRSVIETGFAHEEQHQELFLTDIKHVLSRNSFPEAAYPRKLAPTPDLTASRPDPDWVAFEGGLFEFGHAGGDFSFDNEGPRHKAWLEPFALASRPVSNGEYLAFIEDGGYTRPEFWLSEGWARMQDEGVLSRFTGGAGTVDGPNSPCMGSRRCTRTLPLAISTITRRAPSPAGLAPDCLRRREWEHAAQGCEADTGRWASADDLLHPQPQKPGAGLQALFGEVWEWTRPPIAPIPDLRPLQAPSASTTANSCAVSSSCGADPA
jgi:formylglycine-generating enzyme required for sulfatase activity